MCVVVTTNRLMATRRVWDSRSDRLRPRGQHPDREQVELTIVL